MQEEIDELKGIIKAVEQACSADTLVIPVSQVISALDNEEEPVDLEYFITD